jgi:glycosyltransferase involved in cell wall biosynthesis
VAFRALAFPLPKPYVINGRFLAQSVTGVQRVAAELLRALDHEPLLQGDWQLMMPPGAATPSLLRMRCSVMGPWWLKGHAWEQLVPAAAAWRGARVLNLCGSGPWLGGAQVSWLHDAAVFDESWAYRRGFVAWYRSLFKHRANRGDVLIVPSEHSRQRLAHHLRLPLSRLQVLGHGADHLDRVVPDPLALSRLGLRAGHYWLAVASANPSKNLARLVQAHAGLPLTDRPPLVLVGGANPLVFRSGLAASNLPTSPGGVLELGRVDDGVLKSLYRGALALVMPSLIEGFGLPAVEAMNEGCPVVAARAGALPEVCGDAAQYVDPLDVDSIAAGMQTVLASQERESLRLRGTERVSASRWARQAQRLLQLLDATETAA